MSNANVEECYKAGFNDEQIKKIESIARRISRACKEAEEMGIFLFGGSGSGSLRFDDGGEGALELVACIDGIIDGGDGATHQDDEGLWRGEFA